ncbi:inositol monophosphatase family protein [Mycobacterium tuberculosis]|uniref:inositol monophosphatase family protein n=1 Tax=Mycobacterium tuberculosis TaxID=1773 RepID=UPI0034CF4A63
MVSPAAPDLTDDLTDAELAADLAADAGKLLLQVRAEIGFDQPWTLGEAGDRQANSLLLRRLQAERPGDAHIALWRRSSNGQPEITDAAVALPARGNVVYRTDTVTSGAAPAGVPGTLRIAVSATRPPAVLHRIRQTLAIQPVSIGSAGAKAMAVIDGYVDAYLHAGGQWEWDSAAPAGVMLAAGMHASRLDGSPLRYNQLDPYLPDLLMCRAEVAPILLGAIADAWR